MGALNAIWNSEKGLVGALLIAAATVLCALGHMPLTQWTEYTMYVFGIYVVGKTVQGVGDSIASKKATDAKDAKAEADGKTDVA